MPDRVIRDELDKSERYWQLGAGPDGEVTAEGDLLRLLFRHLLNMADDYGNAEAGPVALSATLHRPVSTHLAAEFRQKLSTVDLVRPYQVGVKWFVHIPRFRQRLRALRGRYPRPPADIECNEMKELIDGNVRQTPDRRQTDAVQPPASRAPAESNRKEVTVATPTSAREDEQKSTPVEIIPEQVKGNGKTPVERAAELAAKLKKPLSGERPLTQAEQIEWVQRQAAKGKH